MGCFVTQCLKTFNTLMEAAVFTIAHSLLVLFVLNSLGRPVLGFVLFILSTLFPELHEILELTSLVVFTDGLLSSEVCDPDVATANALVASWLLILRRDQRDDVTTAPANTLIGKLRGFSDSFSLIFWHANASLNFFAILFPFCWIVMNGLLAKFLPILFEYFRDMAGLNANASVVELSFVGSFQYLKISLFRFIIFKLGCKLFFLRSIKNSKKFNFNFWYLYHENKNKIWPNK